MDGIYNRIRRKSEMGKYGFSKNLYDVTNIVLTSHHHDANRNWDRCSNTFRLLVERVAYLLERAGYSVKVSKIFMTMNINRKS